MNWKWCVNTRFLANFRQDFDCYFREKREDRKMLVHKTDFRVDICARDFSTTECRLINSYYISYFHIFQYHWDIPIELGWVVCYYPITLDGHNVCVAVYQRVSNFHIDTHEVLNSRIFYPSSRRTYPICLRDDGGGNLLLTPPLKIKHSVSMIFKSDDCAGQERWWSASSCSSN
jgi:hypothetical protein